jgi:L-lactate dehydrogenase complex protein LldE
MSLETERARGEAKHAAGQWKAHRQLCPLCDGAASRRNWRQLCDLGAELRSTATYHDSCSALRECNVKDSPRELLKKVKGLEIREMEDTETCCGFGGTFAVKYESIAVAMTDQKIAKAIDVGAKIIVSTDISCLMHMESYSKAQNKNIRFMHLADVLVQGW